MTRDDVPRLRANDPRTPLEAHDSPLPSWLLGSAMDPCATPPEPLPPFPGLPFLHRGAGAVIVGPTGGGRSSLVQAGLYDAARASLRAAYLGSEITAQEFNARAAALAQSRGDRVEDDELRRDLARVRYLDLTDTISAAWAEPGAWIAGAVASYDLIAIDPASAVAAALDLDFDKSNADWARFYDRLVQPLTADGVTVVLVDNVGHAEEAKRRAKGASAKSDRADLTFSCALSAEPVGLIVRAHKVRSVRAGFQRGDEWLFTKDDQQTRRRSAEAAERHVTFRPTRLMQAASEAIEQTPGLSRNAIRAAVGGRAENVTLAVELLVAEGYLEARPQGQAQRHYSIRRFRESTESQPSPDRVPDPAWNTESTESHPLRGDSDSDSVPQATGRHTAESLIAAARNGRISEQEFEREYARIEGAS